MMTLVLDATVLAPALEFGISELSSINWESYRVLKSTPEELRFLIILICNLLIRNSIDFFMFFHEKKN